MFQISIFIPNTIKNGVINSKTPVHIRATNPPPLLFFVGRFLEADLSPLFSPLYADTHKKYSFDRKKEALRLLGIYFGTWCQKLIKELYDIIIKLRHHTS